MFMTAKQFLSLPLYAREVILSLKSDISKLENQVKKLKEDQVGTSNLETTNTYLTELLEKRPLPNGSTISFIDKEVFFSVNLNSEKELIIYDNNVFGKSLVLKPVATNVVKLLIQ